MGRTASRLFRARQRDRLDPAPQNYTRVKTSRGPILLAYGRDPYFAGWPDTLAARLRQPGYAGSDDRRARQDRRPVRWGALRYGHADPAGSLRANLGQAARALLAESDRVGPAAAPDSCSWPRSTGTWSGRCNSRASITPMTSGCTIACGKGIRKPCEDICRPGWITRTVWPAFSKTTTSRERRLHSPWTCTRLPRPSRIWRPPAFLSRGTVRRVSQAHLSAPHSGPE